MTPALTSSSLNLPISASSASLGITPASEFLVALTNTMTRMSGSFRVGFACRGGTRRVRMPDRSPPLDWRRTSVRRIDRYAHLFTGELAESTPGCGRNFVQGVHGASGIGDRGDRDRGSLTFEASAPTMRAMRFLLSGILVVLVLALGYGSTTSGPSIQQACQDLAQAPCDKRSSCTMLASATGPGASLVRVYGDMATCLQRELLACENGLMAPQTGNSPTKVEACVKAYATFSCQDFFDSNPPADCTVTGARANGITCTFNGQCGSGYCQGAKSNVCGVCADPPSPGADCTDSSCGRNQRCVAANSTCQAVVPLN